MFEVWDGDLFLFTCDEYEVDLYSEQGFKILDYSKWEAYKLSTSVLVAQVSLLQESQIESVVGHSIAARHVSKLHKKQRKKFGRF